MKALRNLGLGVIGAVLAGATMNKVSALETKRESISDDSLTQYEDRGIELSNHTPLNMEFVMTRGVEMPEVPNLEGREARRERRSAERKTKGKRKYGYK